MISWESGYIQFTLYNIIEETHNPECLGNNSRTGYRGLLTRNYIQEIWNSFYERIWTYFVLEPRSLLYVEFWCSKVSLMAS